MLARGLPSARPNTPLTSRTPRFSTEMDFASPGSQAISPRQAYPPPAQQRQPTRTVPTQPRSRTDALLRSIQSDPPHQAATRRALLSHLFRGKPLSAIPQLVKEQWVPGTVVLMMVVRVFRRGVARLRQSETDQNRDDINKTIGKWAYDLLVILDLIIPLLETSRDGTLSGGIIAALNSSSFELDGFRRRVEGMVQRMHIPLLPTWNVRRAINVARGPKVICLHDCTKKGGCVKESCLKDDMVIHGICLGYCGEIGHSHRLCLHPKTVKVTFPAPRPRADRKKGFRGKKDKNKKK